MESKSSRLDSEAQRCMRSHHSTGQFSNLAKAWNKTEFGDILKKMEDLNKESEEVSDEEIHDVIHSIRALKAPGPDGLHALFYQKCWDDVKGVVIPMIESCFNDGTQIRTLNHTNIALIPKVDDPSKVNDFIPICHIPVLNGFGGDGYSEVKHVDARAIPGWVTYWEAAPELLETKPGFGGVGYSEVKHVDARAIPGWVTYWEAAPELSETKP
ncbi:hypothetical protein ACLB2K_004617 [Fragaria x ananassa]